MSCFVFGRIYQTQSHEERDQAISGIVQTTRRAGLSARFNEDICQSVVHEMLSKQTTQGAVLLEFLLTANEKDDTSDFIVSPYCLKESDLVEGLSRVEQWTNDLLRLPAIARVDIYITEGYDESFKIIPTIDVGWGERLAKMIYKESYVESTGIQAAALC